MGDNSSLLFLSSIPVFFSLCSAWVGCSIKLQLRRCLTLFHASAELPVQGRGTGRTESSCCRYQDKGFQEKQGPPGLSGCSLMPCSLMLTEPCSAAASSCS